MSGFFGCKSYSEYEKKKSGLNLFYQTFCKKVEGINGLNDPALPRKQYWPNYSILQLVSVYDQLSDRAESYYPNVAKEHFKNLYLKNINAFQDALKERFIFYL